MLVLFLIRVEFNNRFLSSSVAKKTKGTNMAHLEEFRDKYGHFLKLNNQNEF